MDIFKDMNQGFSTFLDKAVALPTESAVAKQSIKILDGTISGATPATSDANPMTTLNTLTGYTNSGTGSTQCKDTKDTW